MSPRIPRLIKRRVRRPCRVARRQFPIHLRLRRGGRAGVRRPSGWRSTRGTKRQRTPSRRQGRLASWCTSSQSRHNRASRSCIELLWYFVAAAQRDNSLTLQRLWPISTLIVTRGKSRIKPRAAREWLRGPAANSRHGSASAHRTRTTRAAHRCVPPSWLRRRTATDGHRSRHFRDVALARGAGVRDSRVPSSSYRPAVATVIGLSLRHVPAWCDHARCQRGSPAI